MAPFDRRGEGLLAGDGASRAPHEQREPVVEPGLDLLRGEGPQPGGRELKRERDAVQARARRPHRRLAGRIQREPWPDRARPLHEQGQRVILGQRRHLPHGLAGHAQRFAAGRQHRHLGAGAQHRLRHLGGALQHMLAVVQAHEHAAVPQLHRHRPKRTSDGLDEHPDRRGDGLGDVGGIRHRLKLDPPDAVRPPLGLVGGGLGGETGLARAAHAGQRHQPVASQQVADGHALGQPSDEPGELDRQVVRDPIERPQRHRFGGWVAIRQLEDPRRRRQIPEAVQAQVDQGRSGRQLVRDRGGRHRRHQRLAAVGDLHQTLAGPKRRSDVTAVVPDPRLARVQRHAQPTTERLQLRPFPDGRSEGHGGGHRIRR